MQVLLYGYILVYRDRIVSTIAQLDIYVGTSNSIDFYIVIYLTIKICL